MKRLLVTGSRDWDEPEIIQDALVKAFMATDQKITLVSGNCPTGADRIAEEFWTLNEMGELELHPAEWNKYGKRAGFVRNQYMVDSGIDLVLGFVKNNSRGASHTIRLAEQAGIKTVVFRS